MKGFAESLRMPYQLFTKHEEFIRGLGAIDVAIETNTNAVILVSRNSSQMRAVMDHVDLPVTDIMTGESKPRSAFGLDKCGACRVGRDGAE